MMLGSTITEARERLSYPEAMQWLAYRNKHGAIATAPRVELQLASLQAMVANALGGKAKPQDFIPGLAERQPEQSDGIDFDQTLSAFKTMGMVN